MCLPMHTTDLSIREMCCTRLMSESTMHISSTRWHFSEEHVLLPYALAFPASALEAFPSLVTWIYLPLCLYSGDFIEPLVHPTGS